MNYRLFPPQDLLTTRVQLPLSKSMSNRALIINALTEGAEPLDVFAQCNDTEAVRRALHDAEATAVNIGAAGSAMRFLTAYFATRQGRKVTIDGDERMRHRPIAPLVDALRQCGAEVSYVAEDGFPPLSVTGKQLQGGAVNIDGTISSQFVSALLMIAPTMLQGLRLTLEGEPASLPYVDLTIDMMQHAGIDVERIGNVITVKPGKYTDTLPPIEADWSAAAFWYELEAVTSGFITLDGLFADSAQGDRHVAEIYADLGVTTDYE